MVGPFLSFMPDLSCFKWSFCPGFVADQGTLVEGDANFYSINYPCNTSGIIVNVVASSGAAAVYFGFRSSGAQDDVDPGPEGYFWNASTGTSPASQILCTSSNWVNNEVLTIGVWATTNVTYQLLVYLLYETTVLPAQYFYNYGKNFLYPLQRAVRESCHNLYWTLFSCF